MAISAEKLLLLSQLTIQNQQVKSYVDQEVAKKATKATTLAGYGITDAYTKTELDGKITSVFHYKGTVASYADLPASPETGDTYNITAADKANGIKAGDNVVWSGTAWDVLAGVTDLSSYSTTEEMNAAIAAAAAEAGIKLTDLSATTTGAGNAVTSVTYDSATGTFNVVKGSTFLTEDDVNISVATDEEVTAACQAVFGTGA